ncbi:hypothetical protein C8R45DRAFT_1055836 [Mycena sanguinolenta]|nr:hypothetical protein C8R45DRAFT_1055836 [Mycena sanguinolenta]
MSQPTDVAPYVLSDWERTNYYSGISPDPPELLYRSDLLERPFPIPKGRHPHLPTKTVRGVFNTPLNAVWDTVAPQIRELLKARKIRYSVIMPARFLTCGEDGEDTLGPVVIWIATHSTSTTAENAYDASPEILALLEANGVEGAVVEWYEGVVERLSGPPLLRDTDGINPTHHVRRFLTTALSMPITISERQGSVTLFFHENKDKHGDPSAKVFGISNCHVLRKDTTVTYEFKGADAPPQHVRLAGLRGLDEIRACRRGELAKAKKDIGILDSEDFYEDAKNQRGDIAHRNIGHVAWAPEISVDDRHKYTKDIGAFEVDAAKLKAQSKGNVVDLGSKFTRSQLTAMFYPRSNGRTTFEYPPNRQLRMSGCLSKELLAAPDCYDSNGEPCLIVMKDGNTTDLTVGHYAGLEAHLCNDLGVESIELAFYNYDRTSGPFSAEGDSGSLIFDGGSTHVTYATPAWWAVEQLKIKYPHADFNRVVF